jgi:hypothetical protein
MDFIRFKSVTQFWRQKVREKMSVKESILPAPNEPIAATATQSQLSGTVTEPPTTPDKCQLQQDALRGAMHDCKTAMKRLGECQDAYFRCQHGVSLQGIGDDTKNATYDAAVQSGVIAAGSGLNTMGIGLEQISISSGVRIDD